MPSTRPWFRPGTFGYPLEPATRVALDTVFGLVPDLSSVRHIRFVLYGASDQKVYERLLEEHGSS